jgi:hypothetical protein
MLNSCLSDRPIRVLYQDSLDSRVTTSLNLKPHKNNFTDKKWQMVEILPVLVEYIFNASVIVTTLSSGIDKNLFCKRKFMLPEIILPK